MKEFMKAFYGHVERMERDRIAKRVYVGKCAGSRSVGRPRRRWADIVKECLKKRGLDVRKARRMVQDKSERWWFMALTTCHICVLPQLYEPLEGWSEWLGFVRGNAWGVAQGTNP